MATESNLETECEIGEAFRSSEHGGGGDRSGGEEEGRSLGGIEAVKDFHEEDDSVKRYLFSHKTTFLKILKAFSSPQPSMVLLCVLR